ncbi:MAG: 4-(cytidine 5'-diphospho)-2-C-methyl-D-erythritol kinase [Pseudomonadota bacterium]
MLEIFSPAKVNLTLHVTGQREDGYHLLDSLVCFPEIGDRLVIDYAAKTELTVYGAGDLVPTDQSNLILQAAQLALPRTALQISLHKQLPVAGGIGGGSSNAGAMLRAAAVMSGDAVAPGEPFSSQVLALGADVPACLFSLPLRMQGIGEALSQITTFPGNGHLLLVNPKVATPTPAVFSALRTKSNAPMPEILPGFDTYGTLVNFLDAQRNDLQSPAIGLVPQIGQVLDALENLDSCDLARMSGSGATCFGLFARAQDAEEACARMTREHPEWWCRTGKLSCELNDILPKGQVSRATT